MFYNKYIFQSFSGEYLRCRVATYYCRVIFCQIKRRPGSDINALVDQSNNIFQGVHAPTTHLFKNSMSYNTRSPSMFVERTFKQLRVRLTCSAIVATERQYAVLAE